MQLKRLGVQVIRWINFFLLDFSDRANSVLVGIVAGFRGVVYDSTEGFTARPKAIRFAFKRWASISTWRLIDFWA